MGSNYCILYLRTEHIVLIHDVIWINKTCGSYISRLEHTKAGSYILQDEYDSYNWYHIQIDTVKTEEVKIEQNVNTKQYSRARICKRHT